MFYFVVSTVNLNDHLKWLLLIPAMVGISSAPLSGWLADAKFGNYEVFRAGAVLYVLMWTHLISGSSLFMDGTCMYSYCTASWSGSDA